MNNEPKDNQTDKPVTQENATDRRELIQKLGKFASMRHPLQS